MFNKKELISHATNLPSLLAIVGGIKLLASIWGWNIPIEQIEQSANVIGGVLVLWGILNNKGMDTTSFNK